MAEELQHSEQSDRVALVQIAESLLQKLPDRSFGQFVRLNMSVFICIAAPESKSFDIAKQALISTGEPGVADILALLGKEHILSELRKARLEQQEGRERFDAAVIDAWRRLCAEVPDQFQKEVEVFISAKAPVIALAARAGIVHRQKERAKFEKFLRRNLQTQADHSVREWLLRNPEFISYLRIDKASLKTLSAILDVSRQKSPAQALMLAAQVLREQSGPELQRSWDEVLRTLAIIGGPEADLIFSRFVLDRIQRGEGPQVRDLLARETSRALLRKNFQSLLGETTKEEEWDLLFNVYGARTTESDLVGLLESLYARNVKLAAWIVTQLIPKLLASESLSPSFHRSVSNRDLIVVLAKELAHHVLDNVKYLRLFVDDWTKTRSVMKRKLLTSIQTGVRIALQHSAPGSMLHAHVSRVPSATEEWAAGDSPKFDSAIEAVASAELPQECLPDRHTLQQIFRGQTPGSTDIALVAGVNPWLFDLVLGPETGPWPKPDLLLDQIVKRFVYVAQLRKRAEQELEGLSRAVRVELALALRDILSDIESDLAGYFVLRDALDQCGLHPVMAKLGESIEQKDLSSERHKIIRDTTRRGRLRVFGLGIRVDDKIVSSGLIINSGDDDDRD
jgi:hypothetical protein